ncbi:GntR family transcriptional regulator [Phenylobacterium sp.]|uniref:GntR family transcriptional regulator n=1 Tax=Phenylobacterium sp. TaxID=1871053 RepID=UPI0035B4D28A
MQAQNGPEGPTLDRKIADALIEDIIAWRFEPGAWIRERKIAERFEVSHGPVREAFRHLSRAGFVEVVPWRGARVIDVELHAVHDVYELWKALFGAVCRLTAERIAPEAHVRLEALASRYERVVRETNDTVEHLRVSLVLGQFISDQCGSPLAQEMLLKVARLARWLHHLARHETMSRLQPGLGLSSAALYRVAVEAIKAGRPDDAERAARELIGFTQTHVSAAIEAQTPLPQPKSSRRRRAGPDGTPEEST